MIRTRRLSLSRPVSIITDAPGDIGFGSIHVKTFTFTTFSRDGKKNSQKVWYFCELRSILLVFAPLTVKDSSEGKMEMLTDTALKARP